LEGFIFHHQLSLPREGGLRMARQLQQLDEIEVFMLLKDCCNEMLCRIEMLRNQPFCLELLSQEFVFGPGIRTLLKSDYDELLELLNQADKITLNDHEYGFGEAKTND
jgi:hypothetical protein